MSNTTRGSGGVVSPTAKAYTKSLMATSTLESSKTDSSMERELSGSLTEITTKENTSMGCQRGTESMFGKMGVSSKGISSRD
jgi:hypothetical protein